MQVGAGKTVVACEMIRLALERGRRCLFLVHRVELVEQAVDRLARFGITAGIIKAGYEPDPGLPVQVACIPTLIRREFPPAEVVIFDECHHAISASWCRVASHYRERAAWIVGITATPERLDGKGLGEIFDDIIEPVTTKELIQGGFLLEPEVYAPPTADFKDVRKRGGDYALPELAQRMEGLTASITEYWHQFCAGRPTLCFAVNVRHSKQIREALTAAGARAMHVDGTSTQDTRDLANIGLREGLVDVVTQCQLWTEGVDIPELERLIIARPTLSLGLHRQMVGRVMRPSEGGSALILDHAGNHLRHGLITDDVEWSLEGRIKKGREAIEPIAQCSACYAIVPPGLEACPHCGEPMVSSDSERDPGVDNPGTLVRIGRDTRKATKAEKSQFYLGVVQEASRKGYKLGWARRRYKDTFGTWPKLRAIEGEGYVCTNHEREHTRRGARCARCYAKLDE